MQRVEPTSFREVKIVLDAFIPLDSLEKCRKFNLLR